jgi:N4-gp56 family major capsid protein
MAGTLYDGVNGFVAQEDTAAIIKKVTQATYDRNLLERALPNLVYDKFAQRRPMKARGGKQMVFRRYLSMTAINAALTEQTIPNAVPLTKTEVVADILQYGNFTEVSDLLQAVGLDDTILEATNVLGENMGESLDLIYREKLLACSNVLRCVTDGAKTSAVGTWGTGAIGTVKGVINKQILDKAINILQRNKAKEFTTMINAASKESTFPVAASYWMTIHPDQIADLYSPTYSNLTLGAEFTPVERYAGHTQTLPGEVGKYRCVRFVATTQVKITTGVGAADSTNERRESAATVCDVYSCHIFGKDSYGIVPLDSLTSQSIIHRAGTSGAHDPLNQINTVGWKAATAVALLNDDHLVRVDCASLL